MTIRLRTAADELDLLIVGSGIAGLVAAITATSQGLRVKVLTKSKIDDSNTRYAQGGFAAAIGPDDSPDLHWQDTVGCGAGLNDWDAAEILTEEARATVDLLSELGVEFDRNEKGLELTREAAHSAARVIHAGGDATGLSIQRGLLAATRRLGIPIVENAMLVDLVMSTEGVVGAQVVVAGDMATIFAERVLLATGGAGQLFSRTTNPVVATGDGLAAAYRAGAELMDLEFFQFHPTALAIDGRPAFLISEAARGEGGVLRNASGEAFMRRYHPDGDLAPRDVVSRAIWTEMTATRAGRVFLDLTHLGRKYLDHRFPTISGACRGFGLDIARRPIPVAPAAHYFMGGIRSDIDGRTSLPGLLVAGEVACTGVHGANRLASNSLLEGAVVGRRAALTSASPGEFEVSSSMTSKAAFESAREVTRRELQQNNWRDIGIVRSADGMSSAAKSAPLTGGANGRQALENANLRIVSSIVAAAAGTRTESRGAHFRSDYPQMCDDWAGHIILRHDVDASRPAVGFVPIRQSDRLAIPA